MENKKLRNYLILETIVIMILCPILHFVYELTSENIYIGAFVPVNESVWEHLKLPFLSSLIVYIFGASKFSNYRNYSFSVLIQMCLQIVGIVIIFYGYKWIFKDENIIVDIFSLYLSVIISAFVKYNILVNKVGININARYSLIAIISILLVFVIFTYCTPKFNIFLDKEKNIYGINKL